MRRRIVDQLLNLLKPKSSRSREKFGDRKILTTSRDGLVIEYSPNIDGDPDPGEVAWAWVPYEDDPSQGKDRPIVIIGRHGKYLAGVPLTSKHRDDELQVPVGTGLWDSEGRPSYAKVERVLDVDPNQVRREGAVLKRKQFDAVVAGVRQAQQH